MRSSGAPTAIMTLVKFPFARKPFTKALMSATVGLEGLSGRMATVFGPSPLFSFAEREDKGKCWECSILHNSGITATLGPNNCDRNGRYLDNNSICFSLSW